MNDDLHLKVMCDFVQIKHITGSTANTFLEYIQRNLPEGMAMKVTRVNNCICCHIVCSESMLEFAIAQLCLCLHSCLSTRCCHTQACSHDFILGATEAVRVTFFRKKVDDFF